MNLFSKSWHLVKILLDYRRGREVAATPPIRMWIESCARCNLRCTMCPNKEMDGTLKGNMSLELFKKILDEAAPFVHDIYLHHRGEPLLNPALFEMIRYANGKGVPSRFHSNGALLDADKAEKLLDAGPSLISFSIDGFEKEPYEKVRVGATFEKTLENVFRFLAMRRARGLKKPYVVIEKIVFNNQKESPESRARIAELTRRFQKAGADEVVEKAEYEWAEERLPEAAATRRQMSKCTFPWYAMVVLWNGKVTPCPQDFWGKLELGNLAAQSIREVWNGEPYRALRRAYGANINTLALCRKCDRLCRKTVGGLPLQYMITFLTDHLVGYNAFRRWLGTAERN
ncbi:MAG: radical SAM/SPASM domain-containing protein [Kiritimatiellia bacterium]